MKASAKKFEDFKKEVLYWLDKFGLKEGWEYTFKLGKKYLDDEVNDAETFINSEARVAIFYLNDHPSDRNIKKTAFHEATELLLGRLADLAEDRFVTQKSLDDARHEIIHVLESLIFNNREVIE